MNWWKNLKGWQKTRLLSCFLTYVVLASVFLAGTCTNVANDRAEHDEGWDSSFVMSEKTASLVAERSVDAIKVTVGTYIENIKELSLRNSYFDVDFTAWFKWQGDPTLDMMNNCRIYNGTITKKEVVKDYHEGELNYQLVRVNAKITKTFGTSRFPLESHQLTFYIESNLPCERVVFVADEENIGVNQYLNISGYDVMRSDFAVVAYAYDNNRGDPTTDNQTVNSEMVTAIEVNRSTIGLYIKCFISLFATSLWALITLYLCSFHSIDPLSMIPSALFGTVANIMVGANLLPDALEAGLLEYVNIWGVFTILACAIAIINVNRVRTGYKDAQFAKQLGIIMFTTILIFTLAGHILMPMMAHM